ncbi:MAG: hypothetical protein AB7E55_23675 [Pigmentiphaga sp.]
MTRILKDIAYVRSGDKGDTITIGVIAQAPEHYDTLRRSVTPAAVKQLFGDWVKGEVEVFEVPNLHSLSVFMRNALGGGATRTLRLDQTGKSIGNAILRLPIVEAG